MEWLRRLFGAKDDDSGSAASGAVEELRARCDDLEKRILWSREKLGERSTVLAELQLQYSDEHARLGQSLRDLHVERARNSTLFSNRDLAISRAKRLQVRIAQLKERLAKYEAVPDGPFDRDPIVLENTPSSGNEPPGGGFMPR